MAALTEALSSGQCPEGLTIKLASGVPFCYLPLFSALGSGKCSKNLRIELEGWRVDDECIRILSQAIQSGKCPEGLTIILRNTFDLSLTGAETLLHAIASENAPIHFKCELHNEYSLNKADLIYTGNQINNFLLCQTLLPEEVSETCCFLGLLNT